MLKRLPMIRGPTGRSGALRTGVLVDVAHGPQPQQITTAKIGEDVVTALATTEGLA